MSHTWILVADAARARLLRANDDLSRFETVEALVHPESRLRDGEVYSDRPGAYGGKGTVDRHSERKDVEARVFARSIGDLVTRLQNGGDLEHLVVVAPPAFLGQLRGIWSAGVVRAIVAEVGRDFSTVVDLELPGMLAPHLVGTVLR